MEVQADELGFTANGCKVIAATDMCGPQVIAFRPDHKIHLLSQPLADHAAAVALGRRVVAEGTMIYSKWLDLTKEHPLDAMVRMAQATLR